MKKSTYIFGLIILVFACEPAEDVVPNFKNTTGGDDEDPIIQGGVMFPDGSSDSDTLVSLINAHTKQVIEYTLTDEAGRFLFQMPSGENLLIEIVYPNGKFVRSEPFNTGKIPAILKV